MISYWFNSEKIKNKVFIPKYYDPTIKSYLNRIKKDFHLYKIRDLIEDNKMEVSTGDEIGKLAYGTGNIPFIRTSDISNWEIKSIPKQGVSNDIYQEYSANQNVKEGDILLVRDGTYLIGTNCFITKLDEKILYQSHILKFRIIDTKKIDPYLFFISLNSKIVQRQIRSIQFTADIIDTIGNRYLDLVLPYPKETKTVTSLSKKIKKSLDIRVKGKAFIREIPILLEDALQNNSLKKIENFLSKKNDELPNLLNQDTIASEFGSFQAFWLNKNMILNSIFLPKYYDPSIKRELHHLKKNCTLVSMGELKKDDIIDYYTGDEIGKMAYGTGDIPFIRTSDFSNWEINHNPKQGISKEIFGEYSVKEDIRTNDLLLVRDGTYLVGTSSIVTESDAQSLFCGGLYKIRINDEKTLNPFLLLGLLNSYIVKRQIRTKQFTRDVIDTIGNRVDEIIIPIPKEALIRDGITNIIKKVVHSRISSRNIIKKLSQEFV